MSCIDCGVTIRPGTNRLRCWPCYCASVVAVAPAWQHRGPYRGCWEWTGHKTRNGYGRVKVRGRRVLVHRLAFEVVHGEVPEGLRVLHHCDNPPCWRPDHLYAGTAADNKRDELERGRNHNRSKAHCPVGHPYDDENTYWTPDGARGCKECRRENVRRYRARATGRMWP